MGIKSHLIQYVVIDWMDLCDVIKIKKHYRIKEKNSEIDSEQLFICSVFKCEAPRALFKIFILRNKREKKDITVVKGFIKYEYRDSEFNLNDRQIF